MRHVALLLAFLVGCYNELRPGRCNRTSDCGAGLVCDLSPTPQGNGRCVTTDGGPLDADGGGETAPECVRHSDCPSERPACSPTGSCVACDAVAGSCAGRGTAKPVCGPGGVCVECLSDSECTSSVAKPICDTAANTCGPCSTDAQCVAKLGADPGVCMSHQDGHCATVAEAIFVQDRTGCASAVGGNAGSADMPFCTVQPAVIALNSDRRLIIIRGTVQATNFVIQPGSQAPQISFVGQQNGAIAGGAFSALAMDGAAVFARDLTFKLCAAPAIVARNSSALVLEHVLVDTNPGGGVLLDSSNFEIRNTKITSNGPGDIGGFSWGGIRAQNIPAQGPSLLEFVTVQNNNAIGVSCSDRVMGNGVLASDNVGGIQASPTCQLTPCSPAGPDCGAQQ